jgi:hypothetical protein
VDQTTLLGLPYIQPSQAQKHVTHNEAIRVLDAIVQVGVLDHNLTVPPTIPTDGDRYIVAAASSGPWAGKDGSIAVFEGSTWSFFAPNLGWLAWVQDQGGLYAWDGVDWVPTGGSDSAPMLGVNTSADATNRLAVKSDAVLFSHDDVTPGNGDSRLVLNKSTAVNSASLVYQTGYSGRAEFGTTGDDDWHVKVSPDGSTWHEALVADKDTGNVGRGTNTPLGPLHVVGDDQGLVLENSQDPDQVWTMAVGRTGIYKDHLIISTGSDIQTIGAHQMRLPKDGAPTFNFGVAVADGEVFASATSGALAYYKPFNGTRGEQAFRGANNSGKAEFRVTGYYHNGSWVGVTMGTWKASPDGPQLGIGTNNPSTTLHVEGPARVGNFTVATVPSAVDAGPGSIIYVTDETGGANLAFSDGTDWRRAADRAIIA